MEKEINDFINSIDNELFNKIRKSKSNAERRRYLKEHLQKQLSLTDVVGQSGQLKCDCKQATFTRTVDEDYNPTCGKCGKTL